MGNIDEMNTHFQRLIEAGNTQNERIDVYLTYGQVLAELKQNREAFDLYSQALQTYDNNSELLYARAIIAERLGDVATMEQDFKTVLQTNPDDPVTLNALGYTLADLTTRYDEAETYILKALELNPNDPATIDSLGWLRFKQRRYDEAEKYLRQAFDLLKDPEIASHLVQTLMKLNRSAEANQVLAEGLKVSPDSDVLLELEQSLSK